MLDDIFVSNVDILGIDCVKRLVEWLNARGYFKRHYLSGDMREYVISEELIQKTVEED